MNLRKVGWAYPQHDNLQQRPNLRRQANSKHHNYEGNIEANGYDFNRWKDNRMCNG